MSAMGAVLGDLLRDIMLVRSKHWLRISSDASISKTGPYDLHCLVETLLTMRRFTIYALYFERMMKRLMDNRRDILVDPLTADLDIVYFYRDDYDELKEMVANRRTREERAQQVKTDLASKKHSMFTVSASASGALPAARKKPASTSRSKQSTSRSSSTSQSSQFCIYDGSTDHTAHTCPNGAGGMHCSKVGRRWQDDKGRMYCYRYNCGDGCQKEDCTFSHLCARCGKDNHTSRTHRD